MTVAVTLLLPIEPSSLRAYQEMLELAMDRAVSRGDDVAAAAIGGLLSHLSPRADFPVFTSTPAD